MTAQPTDPRRTVLATTIGNALEWYDFAVYGFLAPILGKLFFPADDAFASLLAAFGVFAIGYAARPIGGVLFGHLGDRIGRKPALLLSIMAMGTATLAIGLLPDHSQIGTTAALLLVLLLVAQGLSVGGESTGSIVFLAEHAPPASRGLFTSFAQFGNLTGFLLGSAVGALTANVLGQEVMDSWGWRLPFLIGALIAVAGLILRRKLTEPPVVRRSQQDHTMPVVLALRDYWRVVIRLIVLMMAGCVGFYMLFVYATAYLTQQMHLSTARALDINTTSLVFMIAVTPLAAMLSDRVGRKPMLFVAAIGGFVFAWPLWWLMHQNDSLLILAGQMGFALFFGMTFAVIPAVVAEHFPTGVRCSGAALGYNLSLAIFGGTTPLVATYLVARIADDFAPIYYFMAVALLQFIALIGLKEMAGKPLP